MGMLGDFLEALYGPADRFRTARAVIHQWSDCHLAEQVAAECHPAGRKKAVKAPQASRRVSETDIRIWIDGPSRVRVEETRRAGGRAESSLTVVGDDRWWKRDHQGHVEVGEPAAGPCGRRSGPGLSGAEMHFSPANLRQYFVALGLTAAGSVRTAGRECVRVRAVPLPSGLLWSHWLPYGADEYEFQADPERAVLLFISGAYRGAVFETHEVREVAFDERLDPGLFTYEPGLGEQVRPAAPIEHLSLAAAVARVQFTVLVPAKVPDGFDGPLEAIYHSPRVNGGRPNLTLMYMGDGSLWLDQSDTPAALDKYEWEAVERGGRRIEISDPGPGSGARMARLEYLGTHVDIRSDLDRDQLLDMAASLTPVSRANDEVGA
jgi:hypothetical protein